MDKKYRERKLFCSIIIPTIGRSSLTRAVESVVGQEFSTNELEVIVVNDSGQPLSAIPWQRSANVQMIETNRRERSVARNSGAAVARGQYLCFLDDDDWLLPGATAEMWQLAKANPDAAWLYGGIRVMDEAHHCLAEVNTRLDGNCLAQIMGGAWVPIQSSFIRAETFFAVGGYNPFICGTEDQDLCRRIALHGHFANTPAAVACLFRGRVWQTSTNYLRAPEDTRRSRDEVLDEAGSFSQMISTADSSYWHGRILRLYISTALHNWREKRLFTAMSRGLFGAAAFLSAGRHGLSHDYWRAARTDHVPDTLHFIMKALEGDNGQPPQKANEPEA